ncbi:MAG: hypothetical protein COA59_00290 [Colwellia sp.]|nr:MAG: hypothetical protein COA59_00290 [Colwellia sp.]
MLVIDSVDELETALSKYDDNHLFRGQVEHHLNKGNVSIVSSFSRLGCNPPSMQKWAHYCDEVMHCMFGPENKKQLTIDENHAILQHYGWRSFFIDATKDITVAAWFASHDYVGKRELVITEDCYEQGLCCTVNNGLYKESIKDGFLYVISKSQLSKHNIDFHDLDKLGFSDFTPRYIAQAGVMIGSCSEIPPIAITATLKVKNSILLEYAKRHSVGTLFPNRKKDKIYNVLLSTPFECTNNDSKSSLSTFFYKRSLDIPEYDFEFTKINSPNIAFYNENYAIKNDDVNNKVLRCVDSFLYHTSIDEPDELDVLIKMLSINSTLTVECNGLLRLPPFFDQPIYLKGARLSYVEKNLICIGGLTAKHQGATLNHIQLDDGWHYDIGGNALNRIKHNNDCPCNYDNKHKLALTILKKANLALRSGAFTISEDVIYLTD